MSKKGKGPSTRQLRVGEIVRHAITQLLQRGEIPDPLLEKTIISITEVSMTPDLTIATAWVSALGVEDTQPVIKALATHAKYMKRKLGPTLRNMKHMPDLRFRADTSYDNYSKITDLLNSPKVSQDLDKKNVVEPDLSGDLASRNEAADE
ncbi:MAG: 30S ribosome-binding factor RbfA [Rhizobiales bacterium]|nr:30S ribosome-binding factor RbfA [Hyphomicrobiales bacterium]